MKICIYGAGAVGGVLGHMLHENGAEVTLIARREHLSAIRQNGLKILRKGEEKISRIRATDDIRRIERQDLIVMTVKSYDALSAAEQINMLPDRKTPVLTIMNGIPWWYFYGLNGKLAWHNLKTLDHDNRMKQLIEPSRIIGGVINIMTAVTAPGIIDYKGGRRLFIGEINSPSTRRIKDMEQILVKAGMNVTASNDIRQEIWNKLAWNIMFNPLSVVYGKRVDEMIADENICAEMKKIFAEFAAVAAELGIKLDADSESLIEGERKSPPFKTSMLQDFEKGKKLELDGILGAVAEIAQLLNMPCPAISKTYADCTRRIKGNA